MCFIWKEACSALCADWIAQQAKVDWLCVCYSQRNSQPPLSSDYQTPLSKRWYIASIKTESHGNVGFKHWWEFTRPQRVSTDGFVYTTLWGRTAQKVNTPCLNKCLLGFILRFIHLLYFLFCFVIKIMRLDNCNSCLKSSSVCASLRWSSRVSANPIRKLCVSHVLRDRRDVLRTLLKKSMLFAFIY